MVNWLALERMVDRVHQRTWGESVRISFYRNGEPDQSRPVVDTRGLLHVGSDDSAQIGERRGDAFRSRLAAGEAELFLDRATYSGHIPRRGDQVRANDRVGQPWFEVSMVGDHDTNLIVVSLTQG